MKCKHGNITITERGTAYTTHTLENGQWTHASDIGHYSGIIDVECHECGLSKSYGKNRPKWLDKRMFDAVYSYA